ncbi:hypothetical protein FYK55_25760 [Roseiconus nitratireducens]|uniref:Uncharacterized protein n=1 Tax=Roseiconus nitratireducens TaxID=2605748 RepID=A0A5M6D1M7_9BACT|nr:hypothetical protein [Roseiconus nitratireducens]KAA5539005.1 hypothetical protein FYK55_25760 [Roseiconus nitratireducens]
MRFDGDTEGGPGYLKRLNDIANLQELIDGRLRDALVEVEEDITAERIVDWDPDEIRCQNSDP